MTIRAITPKVSRCFVEALPALLAAHRWRFDTEFDLTATATVDQARVSARVVGEPSRHVRRL